MNRSLCLALGSLLWGLAPAFGAGAVEVSYDRSQDRLGVQVSDATLSEIFAQLAREAGIESQISADVAADRLSVAQHSGPAPEVLQRMLRAYNYTLSYRSAEKDRRRLAAVSILGPVGKPGATSSLPPVRHIAGDNPVSAAGVQVGPVAVSAAQGNTGVSAIPFDMTTAGAAQAPIVSQPPDPSPGRPNAETGQPANLASPQAVDTVSANVADSAAEAATPPPSLPTMQKHYGLDGSVLGP